MSNGGKTRAWVEVDLDALRANFEMIRERAGASVALIAMVKADGYGLGAERVVRALDPLGPWGYGVATAEEGAVLRGCGVERPVVVFSPLPPGAEEEAAGAGLTASISELAALDRWAAAAEGSLDFHVEIDTGMGRSGFDWRAVDRWAPGLEQRLSDRVRWTGVFTHFHSADDPDGGAVAEQWERFRSSLVKLPVPRSDLLVHAANSAAALRWPEYAADGVRPGIFLYGGDPAPRADGIAPRPVAAVRARVLLVRDVEPGTTAGYGASYRAAERERWATLGIGYGDGLPRALGGAGEALIRGRRAPIVGRISMDLTVVDVTGIPGVSAGDTATLIGRDGEEVITVDEVAARVGTIGYEILTGLGPRLPRLERNGRA